MDDVAIKVEHVSKRYCKSLRRSMLYGINDIARNMFGLSSHSDGLRPSEFWALDDVSFEVKRGETLGIIGPNGAGKTTLLKLLNGIFWPDKGKITIKGKVGALIEVGAGFHPLLTGRENIYINGAILGMNKKEIDKKFNSIVDFADIGDFLDVPVKHYSSGMYVRLGFAIAIHCELDILLVDEILAVGDINFQSKCFRFFTDNIMKRGCSIIFVSHNRYAVQDICEQSLYLNNGRMLQFGNTLNVIKRYLDDVSSMKNGKTGVLLDRIDMEEVEGITDIVFLDEEGNTRDVFKPGEKVLVRFYYSFKEEVQTPSVGISFFHIDSRYSIVSSTDYVFNLHSGYDKFEVPVLQGKGYFEVTVDCLYIPVGIYTYSVYLYFTNKMNLVQKIENAGKIEILWTNYVPGRSLINLPHRWAIMETGSAIH